MLWWMSVVLWIALVAVSVIFLTVVGFRVFRRGIRTLGEFGEAMDRFEVNADDRDEEGTAPVPTRRGVPGIAVPAVFSTPEEVRRASVLASTRRRLDRRTRRVSKRSERGQPQLLRDLPHL